MEQAITDKKRILERPIEHVIVTNWKIGSFYSGRNPRAAVRGSFFSVMRGCDCGGSCGK